MEIKVMLLIGTKLDKLNGMLIQFLLILIHNKNINNKKILNK